MTLCPIAMAVGCGKCPVSKVCPVKGALGDYKKPVEVLQPARKTKSGKKRRK